MVQDCFAGFIEIYDIEDQVICTVSVCVEMSRLGTDVETLLHSNKVLILGPTEC